MPNPTPFLPATRREFLKHSAKGLGLLAFSQFAPRFLVQSALAQTPPEKDRPILVLVQLAGGNDGLNTLVPFEDANYYRLRPKLGLKKTDVLPVTDTLGLHPGMGALHALLKAGKLGIVQNVGYPNPNRSHFRSAEIWETASDSDETLATGWVGRYLDNACAGAPSDGHDPLAVHITAGVPESFASAHPHPLFGFLPGSGRRKEDEQNRKLLEKIAAGGGETSDAAGYLRHAYMDTLVTETKVQRMIGEYRSEAPYPATPLAASLRNVAALIAAGLPTRVYFVSLSGFDTHAHQAETHAKLLEQLAAALAAFQHDLEAHRLDDQVLTMTFSEFGRRPSENESVGTDHGTAAPLFMMGSRVAAGVHGTAPSLQLAHNQDLTFSTDFRQVYATVLERWLECPPAAVLGSHFETLPLIRARV